MDIPFRVSTTSNNSLGTFTYISGNISVATISDTNLLTTGYEEADGSTLSWVNTKEQTTLDDTDEIQTNILVGTYRVRAKYNHTYNNYLGMRDEGQVKYSKKFTYYR